MMLSLLRQVLFQNLRLNHYSYYLVFKDSWGASTFGTNSVSIAMLLRPHTGTPTILKDLSHVDLDSFGQTGESDNSNDSNACTPYLDLHQSATHDKPYSKNLRLNYSFFSLQ